MKTAERRGPCKVFISYSTSDREIALKLFDDLGTAGARVFQFEQSATPGSDAWAQVLDAIKQADGFVALLSGSAMRSKPVRTEIEYAFYWNVNQGKPLLVPVQLAQVQEMPNQLVTRTTIPFEDYSTGLSLLIKVLGLAQRDGQRPATKPPEVVGKKPDPGVDARIRRFRLPEAAFRNRLAKQETKGVVLENDMGAKGSAWWLSDVFIFPVANLLLGLVSSALIFWLVRYLSADIPDLSAYLTGLLPEAIAGFLASTRVWFESTTLLGVSASSGLFVVGALAIVLSSLVIADDEICIDVADYAVVSFKAFVFASLVGFTWAFLCLPEGADIALYVAGAVALSSLAVACYSVLDEI